MADQNSKGPVIGIAAAALLLGGAALFASCSGSDKEEPAAPENADAEQAKPETAPTPLGEPRQEVLEGGPYPALLATQAWFYKVNGKPKPGPARLQIWRQTEDGWKASYLEDGESNVYHTAVQLDDGSLLTIAAEGAKLKKWTFADGAWASEVLYEKSWGGKFNRLRDIEIGDVDGDGKDEYVIATHDAGVVAVIEPDEGNKVTELDMKADTFVHEIEIGDIDGDGKLEFFATPSDRNKANQSQHGEIVMYRYDGSTYVRSIVDPGESTHAKEILVTDIDGDGKDEVFGVMEGVTDESKKVVKSVTIKQYTLAEDGSFTAAEIVTVGESERQTRFLVPGDFDGDGRQELVASAMKTGIYLIDSTVDEKTEEVAWTIQRFESDSAGFEHATRAADLDGDGTLELYVAADDQGEMRKYTWNAETKGFDRERMGKLATGDESVITWNIEPAKL